LIKVQAFFSLICVKSVSQILDQEIELLSIEVGEKVAFLGIVLIEFFCESLGEFNLKCV
jgi:hypothetical protein